jgi:hypothetical protein
MCRQGYQRIRSSQAIRVFEGGCVRPRKFQSFKRCVKWLGNRAYYNRRSNLLCCVPALSFRRPASSFPKSAAGKIEGDIDTSMWMSSETVVADKSRIPGTTPIVSHHPQERSSVWRPVIARTIESNPGKTGREHLIVVAGTTYAMSQRQAS